MAGAMPANARAVAFGHAADHVEPRRHTVAAAAVECVRRLSWGALDAFTVSDSVTDWRGFESVSAYSYSVPYSKLSSRSRSLSSSHSPLASASASETPAS
jgi:hypothetical protein